VELVKRKANRLKNFDYSKNGAYFITICTKDKKHYLSKISVGESLCALPQNKLTPIGKEVENSINFINKKYSTTFVDKYVIMPNHIHIIIILKDKGGHGNPPLQEIIQNFKSYTTYRFNDNLWQHSFHDHIIRNETDYLKIWEYIDNNPLK